MADMALAIQGPHVALRVAKLAAGRGLVLPRPYFPMTDLAHVKLGIPAALALSILQAAVACHSGMATFAEAGVSDKD